MRLTAAVHGSGGLVELADVHMTRFGTSCRGKAIKGSSCISHKISTSCNFGLIGQAMTLSVHRLVAAILTFLSPPESIIMSERSADQTVLNAADHRQNFDLAITTADGRKVGTFCKEYTFNQLLVRDRSGTAFGNHISCVKKGRKNRKLVVWIHGGPWAWTSTALVLDQLAFVDSGYDLLIPNYPGSSERPVKYLGDGTVDPDVVDALGEVKTAFGWGRRHYHRVDVVGESFGAFLAASLAAKFKGQNALFLINPGVGGKAQLLQLYTRLGSELKMQGTPQERVQVEAKRITDAYFTRLKNYAPLPLLESTRGLNLRLVFGGRDEIVAPAEIQRLARLAVPGCGVDYRPENGHEFSETIEQFESFRRLIRCGRE